MADGGRTAIGVIEETTFGTTPASALATVAYATGFSGGGEFGNVMTDALRSDYNRPKQNRTTEDGTPSIDFELAYGDVPFATLMEGVFRNDWSAALTNTGTTISFDNVGSTIDDSGSGFSSSWANKWVNVSGSTSNDGDYFVTAATAAELTVSATLGDAPLTTEAAAASITVKNDGALKDGTTLKYYTLERNHTDLSTTPFLALTGQSPSGGNLTMETGSLVNGSINFQGKAPSSPAAATAGSGAYTAASTDPVINATSEISAIFEGGAAITANVSSIALAFGTGIRPQHALTNTSPFALGGNSREFTGTLNLFWDDNAATIYDKLLNDTATSLTFKLIDADGNRIIWYAPAIKYRGGNPDVGGVDADIFVPLEFFCELDDTTSIVSQFDRISA